MTMAWNRRAAASPWGARMCSAWPSNKQLQRTVTRRRGDVASAPFHYALAPRFTRQRAAAELRRYTSATFFEVFLTGFAEPSVTGNTLGRGS